MTQEVEQKFLSLLLKDSTFIPKAMTNITEEAFSTPQAGWLYRTICNHFLKYVWFNNSCID